MLRDRLLRCFDMGDATRVLISLGERTRGARCVGRMRAPIHRRALSSAVLASARCRPPPTHIGAMALGSVCHGVGYVDLSFDMLLISARAYYASARLLSLLRAAAARLAPLAVVISASFFVLITAMHSRDGTLVLGLINIITARALCRRSLMAYFRFLFLSLRRDYRRFRGCCFSTASSPGHYILRSSCINGPNTICSHRRRRGRLGRLR